MRDGRDLREALPWLFSDLGFRETMDSAALRPRFSYERGQIFAEIAPGVEPETWWAVEIVLEPRQRNLWVTDTVEWRREGRLA
jgi:hypothetical protein